MATLNINQVIEQAKTERNNQYNKMNYMRQTATKEEFRELFCTRAEQAMIRRKNFSPFIIDDHNRHILNVMYHYILKKRSCEINPHIGIILTGTWGCGKSILIEAFCEVLNDLTYQNRNRIKVVHALELAEDIKLNGVTPYSRNQLCIQDLGKEKLEVIDFGTKIHPLSELLAVRSEYGSLTFGTTNLDIENFGKAYQTFIAKRILEHINWITLPGPDRRPNYTFKT
jgi:DNA replication protein DnaC